MKEKKQKHRAKACPVCGVVHKKRWPCCSRKCGIILRSSRPVTEEARKARAEGLKRWKLTDRGEATNSNLLNFDSEQDVSIVPPDVKDDPFFVEDGDVWHLA